MTATATRMGDDRDPVAGKFPPSARDLAAATAAVAAVYVYFLIFAQFGFLKLVQATAGGPERLEQIMMTMGGAGIAAGVLAAWDYTEARGRGYLIGSLIVAGMGAGLALVVTRPGMLILVAAITGAGTGGATVALAPMLRRLAGARYLGRCIGWGTGLAYGVCNLPALFGAGPRGQATAALVAAGIGILAASTFQLRNPGVASRGRDYEPWGIGRWAAVFLALVAFDSMAFYFIQHTPELRESWIAGSQLPLNALVHLVAAVAAGWALDRGWIGEVAGTACVLLGGACLILGGDSGMSTGAALLYAAGVSLYSTALVFYPASSGRASVAAVVYGVAGWLGSALGIGVAAKFHAIPGWAFPAAGGVVAIALVVRELINRRAAANE